MRLSTILSSCVLTEVNAEEQIEKAVPLKLFHPMGLL